MVFQTSTSDISDIATLCQQTHFYHYKIIRIFAPDTLYQKYG